MNDAIPQGIKHQGEQDQLDNCDSNEPVEEHEQAQDHLHHHRVKVYLLGVGGIRGCRIAHALGIIRLQENCISIEEPDREVDELEDEDEKGVIEVRRMAQTAKDRHPEDPQEREDAEADEIC